MLFYDYNVIPLTFGESLGEGVMENVFRRQDIFIFGMVREVNKVNSCTDIPLVQSRRVLCYISTDSIRYEFNLGTKDTKKIGI